MYASIVSRDYCCTTIMQVPHGEASPGAVLLADQDLNGRQVVRELGGGYLCRIICVAVHLHANALCNWHC